jgi:hypothetical protein
LGIIVDISEDCNSFIFRVKQFRMKAQQNLTPNNTASHPRRLKSSGTQL